MKLFEPCGVDFGNSRVKICIDERVASIPARYALEKPPAAVSQKTGKALKERSFVLWIKDRLLWFGDDVLNGRSIQKIDGLKYDDPAHLSALLRGVLRKWSITHRRSLDGLRLSVIVSIPPKAFREQSTARKALTAYKQVLNGGAGRKSSQLWVRPDGEQSTLVTTRFAGLVREAVLHGQYKPTKGELVLVVDLGGGTNDYAVFNGESEPVSVLSDNGGLMHVYAAINPVAPQSVEAAVGRNRQSKSDMGEFVGYFNDVENRVQRIIRTIPRRIDKIYFIGGGASLMTANTKKVLRALAPKVYFGDEYENVRANYRYALEAMQG